jgi:hypothetical protein
MKRSVIAVRLAISFGFLLLIVLGLGWLGLSRMGSVNADLEGIVSKRRGEGSIVTGSTAIVQPE